MSAGEKRYRAVAKTKASAGGMTMISVEQTVLRSDEVRVKVAAAGICGTDLALLKWPEWVADRMKDHLPRVLGHEFCGYVCDVGSEVDPAWRNAYVAVESHLACGQCPLCLNGQEHICDNLKYVGIDFDGGFADYVAVPATLLHRLPTTIPNQSAAALEAFALATRAVLDEPVQEKSMLVTGLGPLGLMTMLIARARGAASITGVERNPHRVQIAKQVLESVPNTSVIDSSDPAVTSAVTQHAGQSGFDRWIDWSGAGQALGLGISALRRGGIAHLLASAEGPVELPLSRALMKEISFRTIHGRNAEAWAVAVELLSSGMVDIRPLVTHCLPLTAYAEAFQLSIDGKGCKVLMTPNA